VPDSTEATPQWQTPEFTGPEEEIKYRAHTLRASAGYAISEVMGTPQLSLSDALWKDFRKTQIDYPNFTLKQYLGQIPMVFDDTTGHRYYIQMHYTENDTVETASPTGDLCRSIATTSKDNMAIGIDIYLTGKVFDIQALFLPTENRWADSRKEAISYLLLMQFFQVEKIVRENRSPG